MDVIVMHSGRRVDRDHDLLDALRRGDPTEELPTASRALVILREVEGRFHVEVAEALGFTAALVKGRAHRARLFLRKRLACGS